MSTECRMLKGAPSCCRNCHRGYRYGVLEPYERTVDGLVAQVCCTITLWLALPEEEEAEG